MLRLLPLVLIAACGGTSATPAALPGAGFATSTPTGLPVTQVTVVPTVSPAPHLTVSPTVSAAPRPVLVLEPDGLGVLTGSAGIRQLVFHSLSRQEVVRVATQVLGAGRTTELPECGQGPRTAWQAKGFTLLFDQTRWVGWSDQGPSGRTALNGVGVGVTRAFLERSGTAFDYRTSSLGPEFSTHDGRYGGLLSGTTPTSRVTTTYAGEPCFFR